LTPPTPEALEASVKTAGEAFTAWTNKLLALTKVFPPKAEVLLPTDRPDAAWAKDDPDFWADPVVQQYVKKDLDRLNALSAVAGMSRGDLVAAAEQSPVLEVALAAWRRLGEPPAAGVVRWPDTPAELQKELDIRNRLAVMTNAVQSAGDRDPIARDWRVQGPARWRTFTNAAVVPADGDTKAMLQRLDAAVRFRSALLVDDAEIAKLLPAARFNYVLYVARVTVPDVGEGVTRAASDALRRAIAELGNRAEVRTLAARLEKLNDPEPMSVDARLLAPVPPATLNVPIRDRYELSFVRVESPGLRPFYLSETELSLGQFIELVNASGGWTAANALLGNDSVPGAAGPTPLRGPRLWQRPGAANVPIDRFPETWRYDNAQQAGREFTFEPSYRLTRFNRRSLKPELGGNPTYDHPMQQLPARAALFAAALSNCRLPTSREWQAAYEQQRKAQGDAWSKDWNLRDALWQKQIKFTETDAPGQWPLEDAGVTVPAGVFAPAGLKATDGVAGFRSGEDGVLLFRPVNGGAGTFKNLVGNVAELLCDQPDAWDHLADRKTADGIARFVQANGSQLRVVGGSAFSPPELDPLRPAALTSAAEPFCDVGVRLAFTAPARSTAERLKWFIDEQAYLSAEPQP
jgi:formylglycine-generating enzyme required for sulfatase activity